jgi:hypothetical protein
VKKICFFVNLLLILSLSVAAQLHINPSTTKRKTLDDSIIKTLNDSIIYVPTRLVASNFYSLNLGFFCKKELQIQSAIKMPLRFRLGSVAYCDALEGKNNSHP